MEWPVECEPFLPKEWEVVSYSEVMLRDRDSLSGVYFAFNGVVGEKEHKLVSELVEKSFALISCCGPRASIASNLDSGQHLTEFQRDCLYEIKVNSIYYHPAYGCSIMGNRICGSELTISEMVIFKTLINKIYTLKLWLTHPDSIDHKRDYEKFLRLCHTLVINRLIIELGNNFVKLDILPNRVVLEVKFHGRMNPIALNLHNSELFDVFDDMLGIEPNCKVSLAKPVFTIK